MIVSINSIIDRYKNEDPLYKMLKKYYTKRRFFPEDPENTLSKIKEAIVEYYLGIYSYKPYLTQERHMKLISNINQYCDITARIKDCDGKKKVYPVKETNENKENLYKRLMKDVVDYQIKKNISIEETFDVFEKIIGDELTSFKKDLMNSDLLPYYGTINFMIERSRFIIKCIDSNPNFMINYDGVSSALSKYEQKYLDGKKDLDRDRDFVAVDNNFYKAYDDIESMYLQLLEKENELAPIVIEEWKNFLTDPNKRENDYRYLMHSFSAGMVDPSKMSKACCSLHTKKVENFMYGTSGLIYDIDAESVEAMCTTDAGSWVVDKETFVNDGCPTFWQLPKVDGKTVFFEYPYISKLIRPNDFEKDCEKQIEDSERWTYSEIFLNSNAKAKGVFYTDDCPNVEEVEEFGKKYNLPVVHVPIRRNRESKQTKLA